MALQAGLPVSIVTSGGFPIVNVTLGSPGAVPLTVAVNGYGVPVTIVGDFAIAVTLINADGTAYNVDLAWVPANSLIYADTRVIDGYPNGRAWVSGVGVVNLTTLLGLDADANTAWGGSGEINAAALSADGYNGDTAGTALALKGALKTLILAGSTFVLEFYATTAEQLHFIWGNANASKYVEYDAYGFTISPDVEAYSATGAYATPHNLPGAIDPDAINRIAATLTLTTSMISVNGDAVDTQALTTAEIEDVVFALIEINGFLLRSIQVLAPTTVEAELQALSAAVSSYVPTFYFLGF